MWRWTSPEKQGYRLANLVQDLFGEWTVDSAYRGEKLGEHPPPLWTPCTEAWRMSKQIASCAVVVDARDEQAEAFYSHYEFNLSLRSMGGCFFH